MVYAESTRDLCSTVRIRSRYCRVDYQTMKVLGIRHQGSRGFRSARARSLAFVAAPLRRRRTPRAAQPSAAVPLKYPATASGGQADDLNGVRVPDPYRWLENITSPEVRNWVTAQNAVTEAFLARVPRRAEIRDLVSRAWRYSKVGAPFAGGERLFFFENSGLENQSALYVQDKPDVAPRVLIDPNAFSSDGLIAIVDQAPSPDGRYLAYAVTTQGSAWRVVRVRDVQSGQDTGDELRGLERRSARVDERRARILLHSRRRGRASVQRRIRSRPTAASESTTIASADRSRDDRLMFESADNPSLAAARGRQRRRTVSRHLGGRWIRASQPPLLHRSRQPEATEPRRADREAVRRRRRASTSSSASAGHVFFIRTTKGAPRARARRRRHQHAGREPLDDARARDVRPADRRSPRRRPARRASPARRALGARALRARRRRRAGRSVCRASAR